MEATTRLYSSWLDRASECWCVFVRRRFFLAFLSISLKIKSTIFSLLGKTRSSRRMYQTHSSLLVCTTDTATYYAFFFSFAQTFIMFYFRLRECPRTITPPQSALWKIDDEK